MSKAPASAVVLGLTVFLTPLIPATSMFGFEQIKVLFFIVSITLIGFVWMRKRFKWTNISKVGWVFILILMTTSLLGVQPLPSILGAPPYFQGLILYTYFYLFYILVRESKIKLEVWSKILVGSAILVSFIAIRDWVFVNLLVQNVSLYAGRVVSTFGQPNFYAGFLLLTLPFTYRLGKYGWLWGLILVVGILVSYSRSAVLLALTLMILGLIYQLKIKYKLGGIILGTVLLSIYIAWKLSSGIVGNEINNPIANINSDLTKESVEKRVYILPLSFHIASDRLFTGFGLENIPVSFSNYFNENKHVLFEENLSIKPFLFGLKDTYIDRTHNYFLDVLMFSGILGLVSYLVLVLLLLKKSFKTFFFLPLLIYLIWVQFQNQSIVHLMFFWFLAGLIDKDLKV